MSKKTIIYLICWVLFSTNALFCESRFAIDLSPNYPGVGFSLYNPNYAIGTLINTQIANDQSGQTAMSDFQIWGELRNQLNPQLIFATGLGLSFSLGQTSGQEIESVWSLGPYVCFETMFTPNIMGSFGVSLLTYSNTKYKNANQVTGLEFVAPYLVLTYQF